MWSLNYIMKKILLVNYTAPDSTVNEIPYLWLTLKSYFQRNSKDPSAWQWLDPEYSDVAESPQELIDRIVDQEPDVLGISCYMWNDKLTMYVAEQVKRKLPNIKIIAGGPALYYEHSSSWFVQNWFIDALCEYAGYGEVFITDYLDGVPVKDIPFSVYPSLRRAFWCKGSGNFERRSFKYPMPYLDNIEYLERFPKDKVKIILDTTRGCPYSCTFCEWGGGTSSKVVFKPLSETLQELKIVFSILEPAYIDIINANFGVVKEDITVAEYIADKQAEYNCVRQVNIYGPTKTNKRTLKQIYDIFLTAGVIDSMKLSIQSTTQEVLNNIKRVDMSYEDQLELYNDMCDKHNVSLRFETMIGLPGETLDSYYEMIGKLTRSKLLEPMMHEWMMLPSAPAANPKYINEMKLQTKEIRYLLDTYDRHVIPRNKYFVQEDSHTKRNILLDQLWLSPYHIVVGSYSYSIDDWVEMELFKYYFTFLNKTRVITAIQNRLRDNGVDIGKFNRELFNEFLLSIPTVKKVYADFIANVKIKNPTNKLNDKIVPKLQ